MSKSDKKLSKLSIAGLVIAVLTPAILCLNFPLTSNIIRNYSAIQLINIISDWLAIILPVLALHLSIAGVKAAKKPEKRGVTYAEEAKEKVSVVSVELSAAELKQVTHVYSELPKELPHGPACRWEEVVSGKKTMEAFVSGLTDEQLAYLCIGAYKECEDMMEVIGNASISVAGAA